MKTCTKCGEGRDEDEFSLNKTTGYYMSWCKPCMVIYVREHKAQQVEAARAERMNPARVFADILARKK